MSPVNYKQNFDLLPDGPLAGQDGFTGTGWTVQTAVKFAGAKAIQGGSAGNVERTFAGVNDEIHWGKIVIRSSNVTQNNPFLFLGKSFAAHAVVVGPLPGYMQAFNGNGAGGGAWLNTGVALVNDGWYVVKTMMNHSTKKWDVYVSAIGGVGGMDVPKLTDLGFRYNTSDSLNWLRLFQNTVSAKYLDELEIADHDMDAVRLDLLSNRLENNPLMGGGLLH